MTCCPSEWHLSTNWIGKSVQVLTNALELTFEGQRQDLLTTTKINSLYAIHEETHLINRYLSFKFCAELATQTRDEKWSCTSHFFLLIFFRYYMSHLFDFCKPICRNWKLFHFTFFVAVCWILWIYLKIMRLWIHWFDEKACVKKKSFPSVFKIEGFLQKDHF